MKSVSSIKPINHKPIEQQIEDKKVKLLQVFREDVLQATSMEELEAIEKLMAPLKPTLAAVKNQQQAACSFPSSSTVPHNKIIQPQRRLFSTQKSKKKSKLALKTPSAGEADVLAIQMLNKNNE